MIVMELEEKFWISKILEHSEASWEKTTRKSLLECMLQGFWDQALEWRKTSKDRHPYRYQSFSSSDFPGVK